MNTKTVYVVQRAYDSVPSVWYFIAEDYSRKEAERLKRMALIDLKGKFRIIKQYEEIEL